MQHTNQNRNHEVIRHKPLTPIEKLLKEKIELREKCRIQEKKIRDDFTYIQDNASNLLLSGVSTLLFPSRHTTKNAGSKDANSSAKKTLAENETDKQTPIAVSDLFALSKTIWPVAWEIIQPMLVTWSIRKASSIFLGLFSKRKKSPPGVN